MIPKHTQEALDRYVNQHIMPGSFLLAVLSNRLFDAVARADRENLAALKDICLYIYNELPGDCWGSSDIVYKWVESRFYQSMKESC